MKLEFEIDAEEIGRTIGQKVTQGIAHAADESVRYGSLGRSLKDAAEKAAQGLAVAVLADPAFRAEVKAALSRGILRGVEARGEKIAKGMSLQRALELAGSAPRE